MNDMAHPPAPVSPAPVSPRDAGIDAEGACCLTLFPAPVGPKMTAICIGTPRGGTSMVAGVMAGLGLPMGHGLGVNIEDPDFNPDHRRDDVAGFLRNLPSTITARNHQHPKWGWKYPHAADYLPDLASALLGPRLVVVLRDPVPAALRLLRGAEARPDDALMLLQQRTNWQARNLALVHQMRWPCLLVSYEKAAAAPLTFINELAEFLQMGLPDDAGMDRLCRFMQRGEYKPAPIPPAKQTGGAV